MSKRGLPTSVQMRHDFHYVEELSRANRTVGRVLPIGQIEPNPEQPRTEFGDLTELTESIKEKGVLEPLLVQPKGAGKWMIIAGERRWRASNLAGLTEVPCIELDIDDKGVAEIALIENLQRKDLTIWEEADGLAALKDKFGYTHDEIAKKISKSRTTVTELMTIAGLPSGIRERCHSAEISSKSSLLDVARQFDEAAMYEYLDDLTKPKAKTGQPSTATKPKTAEGRSSADHPEHSASSDFKFESPEKDFKLQIKFAHGSSYSKRDVLSALKRAFDEIKNSNSNIGL